MITRLIASLVLLLPLGACATPMAGPLPPQNFGVVSAADPRAAEAGASILRQGGTATDAAIATMLALTVVEPQSSGIGGGGFFVRGTADGAVTTIDGRETAPAAAGEDWFLFSDGQPVGYRGAVMTGLSTGVPGNIRLAEMAHRQHGRLDWTELFAPAIKLASEGYILSERGHEYLSSQSERAARDPAIRPVYFGADNVPLPVGSLIRNPDLAETLQRIAIAGAQYFYEGPRGAALAAKVAADTPRTAGMTAADIANYRAAERSAVCGEYRSYRICGMGPPSSGATTVFAILKQLEAHDLAALGAENPVFWHLFAESQRLAYADRERYLADGDYVSVPVAGLMDGDYLAARGGLIAPDARMADVSHGLPADMSLAPPDGDEPAENGTSHFVVVDGAGNAVSYTSTIEGSFGSGLTFGGFYLNNELTDFSFTPEKDGRKIANRVQGGKRPRSSMSPTLVYAPDGELVMAIGAAGGSTIPVQVARGLIGMIDFGMTPADALALPVLYSPGDAISVEAGTYLEDMIPALRNLGHDVAARGLPLKANAARKISGIWVGAADPRSEGIAVTR
ncbi:gamma-glutamyltransferase family protein [Altererythrobacter aquiaggeris]|uniref:gamma-glutamyltransferase family protein n=1 Tax=Aestuarierythrobacter aquiaggeris TaxID=1898396 RepID=UPI0030183A6C